MPGSRLKDIIVLQGPPVLGAIVAARDAASIAIEPFALVVAVNVCLIGHVFTINDWANAAADLADPVRAPRVFTARGISRRRMAAVALGLLVAALLLAAPLGPVAVALTAGIAALSAAYSLPMFAWKGRPGLSSAAHLAGGVLHFLLGYAAGGAVDGTGIAVGAFCAATFTGGHLVQEIRDLRGDAGNGIRTNAVAFGPRRVFLASVACFSIAHGLLLALALTGALPRPLAGLVLLYPLQMFWAWQARAEGLTRASVCRYQARYRLLFGGIGVAFIAAMLW